MRLSKRGIHRNCGVTEVIRPSDSTTVKTAKEPTELLVVTNAKRGVGSSYHYYLRLSPTEVIRLLLTLPTDTIPKAVEELREEFNLSELIPELQKVLTNGVIEATQTKTKKKDNTGI
jgi:hypothetical protein